MKKVTCRSCGKVSIALDTPGIQNEIYKHNLKCASIPHGERKKFSYKTMGDFQQCPWCGGSHKNFRELQPEDKVTRTRKYVLDRRAENKRG